VVAGRLQDGRGSQKTQRKLEYVEKTVILGGKAMVWKNECSELEKRYGLTDSQCKDQIAKLRNFLSDVTVIFGCIAENSEAQKAKESLVFFRFLESVLHLNELLSLLMAAHYTSAAQILRYRFESVMQALYLDQQHSDLDLEKKLCILREISDKREYFVTRLINNISIDHKDHLRRTYKDLSATSHPSHLNFPTIKQMIGYLKKIESSVDCNELNRVITLTLQTYDAIFFVAFQIFDKAKEAAKKTPEPKKVAQRYGMLLLSRTL
jgi:hypothetical protein